MARYVRHVSGTARRLARVVVLQTALPHYRVPFFEGLRRRLAVAGVDLSVAHGPDGGASASKGDAGRLPWADEVRVRHWRLGGRDVVWHAVLPFVRGADLVVVEQAVKNLTGMALLARHVLGGQRVALWGHGRNFQARQPDGLVERWKTVASRRAHWWFAYNDLSAGVVGQLGYPRERITVVDNAIDTTELSRARAAVSASDVARWRAGHGVRGRCVCVYAGGLFTEKRLPFLVAAGDVVRSHEAEFELVVLGGGPEIGWLQEQAATRAWLHVLGPTFGPEKVVAFAASKLLLIPGLVGLAVLDAFALGTPLVTVSLPQHGPEIAYLEPGVNGMIVPAGATPAAYASEVLSLLRDEERRSRMIAGCRTSATRYTIENMVERFTEGVSSALASDPYRGR